MVKTYLRYVLKETCGLITSENTNCIYNSDDNLVITSGVQNVLFWNAKTGVLQKQLQSDNQITYFILSPNLTHLAVGYITGLITVWDIQSSRIVVSFRGHNRSITALCFNYDGSSLVSGSSDTTIIVWDLISESGLFRLRGHTSDITAIQIFFDDSRNITNYNKSDNSFYIATSSKDGLVKIWDYMTQHCIQTITGHRNEIWSLYVIDSYLLTGSKDNKIRIYEYNSSLIMNDVFQYKGYLLRNDQHRVKHIHAYNNVLICQSAGKIVNFYKILSPSELKKKLNRKKKRKEQKNQNQQQQLTPNPDVSSKEGQSNTLDEVFTGIQPLFEYHSEHKIEWSYLHNNEICFTYLNNSIRTYILSINDNSLSLTPKYHISNIGHRSDIRSLTLNNTDELLVSTCHKEIKIWDNINKTVIRTIQCNYALCSLFLPGGNMIAVGLKSGLINLYDLHTGDLVQSCDAHKGTVWTLAMNPDNKGITSGGSDHQIIFWDFELVTVNKESTRKYINISQNKILKMSNDILYIQYSTHREPSKILLVVSLLDNTVKSFFYDSLKFHLSFYGHKLPVICHSISSDNTLLITGSADKNIKIWGLTFGDCHKSIFGHGDTITQIRFINNTHYFISCGKDGLIKYWDADKFQLIHSLEYHINEIWALCISQFGDMIITGGHDKSIRYFTRTEEMVFVEEERQKEQDKLIQEDLNKDSRMNTDGNEVTNASINNIFIYDYVDTIIETLEIFKKEMANERLYESELQEAFDQLSDDEKLKRQANPNLPPLIRPPTKHPLLMGRTIDKFVYDRLKTIPNADFESSLIFLPFTTVEVLLDFIHILLTKHIDIEFSTKTAKIIFKNHYRTLSVSKDFQSMIKSIRDNTHSQLELLKSSIGLNIAALKIYKRHSSDSTHRDTNLVKKIKL